MNAIMDPISLPDKQTFQTLMLVIMPDLDVIKRFYIVNSLYSRITFMFTAKEALYRQQSI